MKRSRRASLALLTLLLAGCRTEAEKLYEQAIAKETAEGLPAALSLYQTIAQNHPSTESAERARTKVLEYQQARQQAALSLLNEAEGRSEAEASVIYRRIVDSYGDTEVSKIAQTRLARIEAEHRATTFSEDEYRQLTSEMLEAHEDIGTSLLGGTHPSGTYAYTDDPSVVLSSDGKQVTTQFTVHWEGGILEMPYKTVYRLTFNKRDDYLELDRLEVTYDDAVLKVDPGVLKSVEQELARGFRNTPVL